MSHPAPFSKEIIELLRVITLDWKGPLLDHYCGEGHIHDLGRDDTYGIDIERPWAHNVHPRTFWGDSATLTNSGFRKAVFFQPGSQTDESRFVIPRPAGAVFSPDYGNRMADPYLGTPAERALRAATGEEPRRRGYAISLDRQVTPGSGAGFYFWQPEYKEIHRKVNEAMTNVMLRPGKLALNISDVYHDRTLYPVTAWWVAMLSQLGWKFSDAYPVNTRRYRFGANRDLRPQNEWIVVMDLPETSVEHGR